MFLLMQKAEMVTSVTIIIAKAKMNPYLNCSIFLTQAMGENKARTINPKYSYFKLLKWNTDSLVDLSPCIMKESYAIVN
jgi:hypothetical protein